MAMCDEGFIDERCIRCVLNSSMVAGDRVEDESLCKSVIILCITRGCFQPVCFATVSHIETTVQASIDVKILNSWQQIKKPLFGVIKKLQL